MKKILFGCLALTFLASSCKKDSGSTPAAEKYMSLTTDSRWIYEVTTDPGTSTASSVLDTVTVTNTDTTISGRVYRILKHGNGAQDYYFNSGNDYYRFQKANGGAGLDLTIEELYLKDNAAVGTNWSQTIPVDVPGVGSLPVTITNSIIEKGISKTVMGVNYTDVITVKTDISVTGLPAGTIVADIKSYYARRVGQIQGDYKVTIALASVDINTQTLLKSADIR